MTNKGIFFNAQHSPIGAFSSFTLGFPGAAGGFGMELGGPANENVFIGLQSRNGRFFEALPFFSGAEDERKRFEPELQKKSATAPALVPFSRQAISRQFSPATDAWQAGDLTFTVFSPVRAVPDPENRPSDMKDAILPAVLAEIRVDNSKGRLPRTVFIGYQGGDSASGMRRLDDDAQGRFTGVGQGTRTAIVSQDRRLRSGLGFTMESILCPDHPYSTTFGLGRVGALTAQVAPGRRASFRFALCFYRDGIVTAGRPCRYYYTRFFKNLEAVAAHALSHFRPLTAQAALADRRLARKHLNPHQQFMLAHAIRSYYGSTQLLELQGKAFWVVNEGEYRMMNTFDLTVDHLFFETRTNSWTLRNTLDEYVRRFSYRDRIKQPGQEKTFPGGLSFTHDMGVANVISRPGYSAYERPGLTGCFSYMTHEQLVNWLVCALVYIRRSGDTAWGRRRMDIFKQCFQSLLQRDHPTPAHRNGVMKWDSSRCDGGSEITTYDSLDTALGQARNNLYLAVKCWGAYVGLQDWFRRAGEPGLSRTAGEQAHLCASTICSQAEPNGCLPSILDRTIEGRIIPAIEGLVIPYELGLHEAVAADGPFGALIQALKRHIQAVLKPGLCLFADGGWKLSSSSDNSWLSKIYLCQFVARHILKLEGPAFRAGPDAVHAGWLKDPRNAYYAWSDQIVRGEAKGSRYYPRGVTAILWLDENNKPERNTQT
ncbi:MAG TPA: beta-xylosidase [Verrucomicrobia bacterium]|nr:MAG: beta-xylosidase [Lentisphaerae bacterium GWF2_57_35]HBA84460.1 beta-xylosidase [Verrucomicrobiota bacterium]